MKRKETSLVLEVIIYCSFLFNLQQPDFFFLTNVAFRLKGIHTEMLCSLYRYLHADVTFKFRGMNTQTLCSL